MHNWWRACCLMFTASSLGADLADESRSCPAGVSQCGATERYHYWPMGRGPINSTTVSPYTIPRNLSSAFAWSWTPPEGRYSGTSAGSILIDDHRNLYAHFSRGLHKFSPDGKLEWFYSVSVQDVPALMGDYLYGYSGDGKLFAINLETGLEKYSIKMHEMGSQDIAATGVADGIVISRGDTYPGGGGVYIFAANASDGSLLWDFKTDNTMWNFFPMFTEDRKSFVFQDQHGGVYHMSMKGKLLWKAGYEGWPSETWTDGGTVLGPNGLVYSMHSDLHIDPLLNPWNPHSTGDIIAYKLSDGSRVWRQPLPLPPQSWPALARLRKDGELLAIMPIGTQPGNLPIEFLLARKFQIHTFLPESIVLSTYWFLTKVSLALGDWSRFMWWHRTYPSSIWAFSAETGQLRWKWDAPTWLRGMCMGDEEGFIPGRGRRCVPNPWGSPTVDAAGTIFTGNQNGYMYALWDKNGDDIISQDEVEEYNCEAAFSHPGPAIAPGIMAVVSCETLFVFKG